MAVNKEEFAKAIQNLRKIAEEKKRNFDQTVDLIINLRDFDLKKNPLSLIINLKHKVKDKKIAGFLEKKSPIIDTITKNEFDNFKDKVKLKKLIKEYDFFIANAKLMPAVATNFGRVLGPAGKMPNPQLGIVVAENDDAIKQLVERIDSVIKVRPKETSIKIPIGKQSDTDANIAENALTVYNEIFKHLPRKKENLKSVLIKFTMTKPVRLSF